MTAPAQRWTRRHGLFSLVLVSLLVGAWYAFAPPEPPRSGPVDRIRPAGQPPGPVVQSAAAQIAAPPLALAGVEPGQVVPGDTVVLTGTGLDTVVELNVGYKFVYDRTPTGAQRLAFVAPDLPPGKYDVTLVGPAGQRAVLKRALTYKEGPNVSLESVALQNEEGAKGVLLAEVVNHTQHEQFVLVVGQPKYFRVTFPQGQYLPPEGSLPLRLEPRADVRGPDMLVIQAGGTRDVLRIEPEALAGVLQSEEES